MSLSSTDYIKYIAEEAAFITAQTTGASLLDLQQNIVLQRALVRSFEVIGEATKQIDAAFRRKHSQVDWNKLVSIKEKIEQNYFDVDLTFIFNTCQNIPKLLEDIETIINTKENAN